MPTALIAERTVAHPLQNLRFTDPADLVHTQVVQTAYAKIHSGTGKRTTKKKAQSNQEVVTET